VPDVAVIMGGPSPEHDVSVLTGLQATRALAHRGDRRVHTLYWSRTGELFEVDPGLEAEAFVEGVPRGAEPVRLRIGAAGGFVGDGRLGRERRVPVDLAVVCCHGGPGEDGTLQASLDLAGICYAGPSVSGAALGMDKLAFSGVMAAAGLPVLPRLLLGPDLGSVPFPGPYIVKPRFGGSSIGVEVVADVGTARARLGANPHLAAGAVIEPYRPDLTDLQIATRTYPTPQLSAVERPLRSTGAGGEILGYADKYVGGEGMASAPRELPATLSPETEASLRQAAEAVTWLCGVRGVARIDFLSDGAELVVNEINTIPGSLARYLWIQPPLTFVQLLDDLLAEAQARPTHHYTASGADGTVLRGAATIAAKLA